MVDETYIADFSSRELPGLTQTETETILESTAVALDAGCAAVRPGPGAAPAEVCWGSDATGAGLVNAVDALEATAELAKLG